MRKGIFLLLLIAGNTAFAQTGYFQQHLTYTINVELNDKTNTLTGSETIVYKNNSGDALPFIWFHIWPNAYKNENTAMFQQIKNDSSRSKKLEHYSLGDISGLQFKVGNKVATTEPHPNPQYIDVIKVILPTPLKAGDSVVISTPFIVKLPSYFSRSGFADGEFMACQWYPKPAVYDKTGWHEFPYLDMGELYSEYADYKVSITLPSEYVVGATGVMQSADELAKYKSLGAENLANTKKQKPYVPANKSGNKTLSYYASNVVDFAWFADKNFIIEYDTIQLNGKTIDAFTYYHDKKNTLWTKSLAYVKDAVRHYSSWIGDYAYPVVQAVEGPANNASGGMEYPMVTLITSPDAKEETLDAVIAHEVGHNWFMAMLGSNERMHTWQDEGLNTYFQFRYEAEKYRTNSIFGDAVPKDFKKLEPDVFLSYIYKALTSIPMNSAIDLPADKYPTSDEYGLISYVKTALWMYLLEQSTSREKIDKAFHDYFAKWQFKHPQPEDMKAAFEESLGADLTKFFGLLGKKGSLVE